MQTDLDIDVDLSVCKFRTNEDRNISTSTLCGFVVNVNTVIVHDRLTTISNEKIVNNLY